MVERIDRSASKLLIALVRAGQHSLRYLIYVYRQRDKSGLATNSTLEVILGFLAPCPNDNFGIYTMASEALRRRL